MILYFKTFIHMLVDINNDTIVMHTCCLYISKSAKTIIISLVGRSCYQACAGSHQEGQAGEGVQAACSG